jgi:hypothetical protein
MRGSESNLSRDRKEWWSQVGRTPRPRRTPWSGSLRTLVECRQGPDEGVGRGPGSPPHQYKVIQRISNSGH